MSSKLNGKKSFGKTAKDIYSGFTGVITGFCQYVTGCDKYLLSPKGEKPHESPSEYWLDDGRLEIVSDSGIKPKETKKPGGSINPPK